MLEEAAKTCCAVGLDPAGRLVPDRLPELAAFPDADFDAAVCSAVLMHLPDAHLFDAVYALRRILRPGGRLLVSIPARRPDIDPATRRDAEGRFLHRLPSTETEGVPVRAHIGDRVDPQILRKPPK